jgi:DNA-binding Lrp family transcriptional regulator
LASQIIGFLSSNLAAKPLEKTRHFFYIESETYISDVHRMQLDETDRSLLTLLAENARTPIATLARRLNLARTTVQTRLDRLETNGAIKGYTLIPGTALAPAIRATALVQIEPRTGPSVLARLKSLSEVKSVHTTSGRWDLVIELTAETTEALDDVLDRIAEAKGVKGSESLIHLSTKLDRSGNR